MPAAAEAVTERPAPSRPRDTWLRVAAVALVAVAVLAAVLLARGNDPEPAAGPPAADIGDGPVDRTVSITIANRTATPPTSRVEIARGSTIRITVTSDAADELHVHGHDRRATLTPGVPASVAFRADTAGLFEVETHLSDLVLVQLVVR
ncbi:hypothetical protein [Dactylosporangium sp. CA-139066]|uniref:hypothetical protein n=1 Tax=Dactylosporangium sp. CA-139066 TaxID=3239930 RepID=UPI003D8B59BF